MNQERNQLLEAIDENSEVGFIDSSAHLPPASRENSLAVRLGDGVTVFAPAESFTKIGGDKFQFNGKFDVLRRELTNHAAATREDQKDQNQQSLPATETRINKAGEIVVPLIAEELNVAKKTVETGGVRIHKIVRSEVQTVDEPIVREHLEIERVAVNRFVETAPVIRYEGEVMIVPVLEEVVVTQKRLMLREEIRLIKRREEISSPQEITLRREEINLEKIETANTEPGATG